MKRFEQFLRLVAIAVVIFLLIIFIVAAIELFIDLLKLTGEK